MDFSLPEGPIARAIAAHIFLGAGCGALRIQNAHRRHILPSRHELWLGIKAWRILREIQQHTAALVSMPDPPSTRRLQGLCRKPLARQPQGCRPVDRSGLGLARVRNPFINGTTPEPAGSCPWE